MKGRIILTSIVVLMFVFSITEHDAFATVYTLDSLGSACPTMSGTWDNSTLTCQTTNYGLSAQDRIVINPGITLTVTTGFDNAGKIENFGTINIENFFSSTGIIDNNSGNINNYLGSTLLNSGTMDNSGSINNNGDITVNSGAINNDFGTINNYQHATITNYGSTIGGIINNNGVIAG